MLSYEIIFLTAISVVPLKTLEALKMTKVALGEVVTLKCDLSFHYEINWLRMDSDMKPETLMAMGLNNNRALVIIFNSNQSRFDGFIKDRYIKIRIFKVSEADLVTYFCTAADGKLIVFGEGIQLYTTQDVNQASENCTQCDQGSGEMSTESEGQYQTCTIYSGVLSCGILLMVLTIVTVHVQTSRKRQT